MHCVGIIAKLHPNNHVSTCTRELVEITTEDKEVMVKPAVFSAGYNTDVNLFFDTATNTEQVEKNDVSTQIESTVIVVMPVHKLIVKMIITAPLYVLRKFRITAML